MLITFIAYGFALACHKMMMIIIIIITATIVKQQNLTIKEFSIHFSSVQFVNLSSEHIYSHKQSR